MNRISLHEEYRLIERSESEINGAWKGAHLLLFFLAFVFGSFCTFCFHVLMYLFDEKCVLFPKLLSMSSMRHSIVNDFWTDKEKMEGLNMDFVSAQWVEQSACYLPTYVPLVSGIFGLVWTTMFLMCSSGDRTQTGLQQPWRIIPPVFVFSLAMGGLCTYTSIVTYNGLQELCLRLGEVTGSKSCTYAVNVATLAYERRIRGVYQATRLTIFTAWVHTACWLLAALLALIRILLVVDFRLVRVQAELVGDIDKMLERHEQHLSTVSPVMKFRDDYTNTARDTRDMTYKNTSLFHESEIKHVPQEELDTIHFMGLEPETDSEIALVPEEEIKLTNIESRKMRIISQILDDMIEGVHAPSKPRSAPSVHELESEHTIVRQLGQRRIYSKLHDLTTTNAEGSYIEQKEAEDRAKAFRMDMQKKLGPKPSLSFTLYESKFDAFAESEQFILDRKIIKNVSSSRMSSKVKKSNLKAQGNQTEPSIMRTKGTQQKVKILESKTSLYSTVSEETLRPYRSEEYRMDETQLRTDDERDTVIENEVETVSDDQETASDDQETVADEQKTSTDDKKTDSDDEEEKVTDEEKDNRSLRRSDSSRDAQNQSLGTQDKETQTPEKEKQD